MQFFKRPQFIQSQDGLHQIGGSKPAQFKFPENSFPGGFQYLGFFNNNDPLLEWLPFSLHLIHPIYLNFDRVFLDYSNPLSPTLISPKNTFLIDTEYDEWTVDSFIEFEGIKMSLSRSNKIDNSTSIGIIGRPQSINAIQIPRCPINNNKMRFVAQLMTFGEVPATKKNFTSRYSDFDHLCFWGDGSLFIYMAPKTKIVCYYIKNT